LAEAKAQCRVDTDLTIDDTLLTSLIAAARGSAEKYTGTGIMPQSWQLTMPCFPQCGESIVLPRGPVVSIGDITYLDGSGVVQTLDPSTYVHEASPLSDRLSLPWSKQWPSVRSQADAITIPFTVGFVEDASADPLVPAVPEDFKRAMLLRIGDLYRNREGQIIGASTAANRAFCDLLDAYVRELLA
jgi:uncharacterized phiE125 gp8 family phage protein